MARPTTAARRAASGGEPPRRAPTGTTIRPDIQALRALAVAMVLVYHLWPNRLSGGYAGVDVFFVISGFLITAHLLAKPPSRGHNLLEFWSRRVRRLLPAALLVLAATLVATRLVAPSTSWAGSAKDIRAAALYFVNWRFAAQSVDYLGSTAAPSPVEHFWSLSVEEQFYLVWPVLILVLVGVARWRRWRLAPVTIGGLSLVVAASLAYSVYATRAEPAQAYFVTPTRIWELGLGGLLAAALSSRALGRNRDSEAVPLPPAARVALTWAGLAAMVVTAFVYTGNTPFPGYQALLPVLGCVAVIAAMPPRTAGSPAALMAWRPVQWLGDVSYSVYLWHWPMIVLVPYVSGDHLGRLDKGAIVVATLLLAGLTKVFVEDRFRKPAWGRPLLKPYALGATIMAVVVAGSVAQLYDANSGTTPLATVPPGPCVGAAALQHLDQCPHPIDRGPLWENARQAANDQSDAYPSVDDCFANDPDYRLHTCHYGATDADASLKVALVGNSHAAQWLPALQLIAKDQGWSLHTYLASRCANATGLLQQFPVGHAAECAAWARTSTDDIAHGGYDLVFMSNRVSGPAVGRPSIEASQAEYEQGYLQVLRTFVQAGLKVIGLRDTPAPGKDIPDCLDEHGGDYATCGFSRHARLPADPLVPAMQQLNDPKQLELVNIVNFVCPHELDGRTLRDCPAVVGRVPVYFDNSHMTGLYAMTLAPIVWNRIEDFVNPPPKVPTRPGDCVGADAIANSCPTPSDRGPLRLSPSDAARDQSDAYGYSTHPGSCFANKPAFPLTVCHFGADAATATARVALVGNSHAGQWLPPLRRIAEQEGWSVTAYLASRCANADVTQTFDTPARTKGCRQWANATTSAIVDGGYDLVVMTNRPSVPTAGHDTIAASQSDYTRGYRKVLQRFAAAAVPVVAIRDTPAPSRYIPGGYPSIPKCLAAHPDDPRACDGPRSQWIWAEPVTAAVDALHDPKITEVDLNSYICPRSRQRCPAVVGQLPVYFDNSHMTATFAATLAPYLKPYLLRALRP